jgi:hypothetical protein
MDLAETKYVVLPEAGSTKPETESWRDVLRRWLIQCPNCAEIRLVVGARENDGYVCKDCGHSFIITFSAAANDSLSN